MTDCRVCATPLPADARFCMACGVDTTDPGTATLARPRDLAKELEERLTRTLAGRYEVRRLLGAGGMASVYLADEIGLDRPVAIKVLPPELARDEGLVARFQREARTAAKLDHPNIIPIHRVESEAGLHYFVMKYVPGRSLESLLDSNERIPIETATRILREAATALGHAHARGVVHRDVKPANIMLDQDGRVVLTDFGIARAGESTQLTQTGMIIGTPHYMAPEQAIGSEVDGRADQYALGVVAYEMLAGSCPFSGDSAHTIIYKHIHEPPKSVGSLRSDLPGHVVEAVSIALAKDPKDRFAKMEDFARALGGDESVFASRPSRPTLAMGAGAATLVTGGPGRPVGATGPGGVGGAVGEPTPSRVATVRMNAPALPRRARRTTLWAAAAGALVLAAAGGFWATSRPDSTVGGEDAPGLAARLPLDGNGDASSASPVGDGRTTPSAETAGTRSGSADPSVGEREPSGSDAGAPTNAADPRALPGATGPRTTPGKSSDPRGDRGRSDAPPARGAATRDDGGESQQAPRTAPLTVNSEPYGTLYIDDVLIGDTPVANHPLEVGRRYRMRVEREGYKPWTETITVNDPNPIRRSKPLDPVGGPP